MSGDRYKIDDQQGCYFVTMTVVHWIDIFSRQEYRDIIVNSLNYCVMNKGLKIFSWVVMTNHVHLVCEVEGEVGMSGFLRDFKKFTSKRLIEEINQIHESRKDWLLDKFSFEAKRSRREKNYKIWKDDNHAVDMSNKEMLKAIHYIHDNPVKAGIVDSPQHYLYSSAIDYDGGKGFVQVEVL